MKRFNILLLLLILCFSSYAFAIDLAGIEVRSDGDGIWKYGESSTVYVNAYSLNNTPVDVEYVSIELEINEDINYTTSRSVIRDSVGKYYKRFDIPDVANITSFNVSVIAKDGAKTVTRQHEVSMENITDFDKTIRVYGKYMSNTYNYFADILRDYWLHIIIFVFSALSVLIAIDVLIIDRKK